MGLAIITGSGLEEAQFGACLARTVETPYGRVRLDETEVAGTPVFILPRHGADHSVPPHRINYRANLYALRQVGCTLILATNAVGSLRQPMKPGDFVLPNQFIDFTHGRKSTFFDDESGQVKHVDVSEPYCPNLRHTMGKCLAEYDLPVHPAATYLCTQGPRFETPAEIGMFAQWGADLVGMTGVPEVVLAREAGVCYASLCLVTNWAAGMTSGPITDSEVRDVM